MIWQGVHAISLKTNHRDSRQLACLLESNECVCFLPTVTPLLALLHLARHTAISADGIFTYEGSDEPEETLDGRPGENVFRNNIITNTQTGVKIKRADNTRIFGETTVVPESMVTAALPSISCYRAGWNELF